MKVRRERVQTRRETGTRRRADGNTVFLPLHIRRGVIGLGTASEIIRTAIRRYLDVA